MAMDRPFMAWQKNQARMKSRGNKRQARKGGRK